MQAGSRSPDRSNWPSRRWRATTRPTTSLQAIAGYDEFLTATEDDTGTLDHAQWTFSIGMGVVF